MNIMHVLLSRGGPVKSHRSGSSATFPGTDSDTIDDKIGNLNADKKHFSTTEINKHDSAITFILVLQYFF